MTDASGARSEHQGRAMRGVPAAGPADGTEVITDGITRHRLGVRPDFITGNQLHPSAVVDKSEGTCVGTRVIWHMHSRLICRVT